MQLKVTQEEVIRLCMHIGFPARAERAESSDSSAFVSLHFSGLEARDGHTLYFYSHPLGGRVDHTCCRFFSLSRVESFDSAQQQVDSFKLLNDSLPSYEINFKILYIFLRCYSLAETITLTRLCILSNKCNVGGSGLTFLLLHFSFKLLLNN